MILGFLYLVLFLDIVWISCAMDIFDVHFLNYAES